MAWKQELRAMLGVGLVLVELACGQFVQELYTFMDHSEFRATNYIGAVQVFLPGFFGVPAILALPGNFRVPTTLSVL
jgi:hypothetical protein